MDFWVDQIGTPIGELVIVADQQGALRAVDFADHDDRMRQLLRRYYGLVHPHPKADPYGFSSAMKGYFAGSLDAIAGLPTETAGFAFQRAVWRELRRVPCGTTVSYGALATRLAKPGAARAVGLANGAKPIGIVVPCHRVIGANGALTGYGGGLERKRWLLANERVNF